MKSKPLTDTYSTLGALLRRPYEHLSVWMYSELAKRGFDDVRPAFSAVLRNLPSNGSRVVDLAARAGMTKQSMGYLVEQMATAKLVEIKPHPDDGRATIVSLTERGEVVLATMIGLSRHYESQLGALIGEKKAVMLRDILQNLYERLDDSAKESTENALHSAI